jgi:acetate kinase
MAAIHNGRSVDTTMGFSPDAGLVMSSRAGDIDAAAVLHLIEHEGMSPASVRSLLNQRAGLLGLSGTSADMQTLLGQVDTDANAAAAVDMFCYRARRTLGGYIAVLGGIDALVFTGGIGENSAEIRKRICGDLAFLGIEIDQEENGKNSRVISSNGSPVHIRVMSTDEDLIIAQEALALLRLK